MSLIDKLIIGLLVVQIISTISIFSILVYLKRIETKDSNK